MVGLAAVLGSWIAAWFDKPRPPPAPGPAYYHAYTTQFDRVVDASDLPRLLDPLSSSEKEELWAAKRELEFGLMAWRTKLSIIASERAERLKAALPIEERKNIVVSILIDHSGSMRGQKILFVAACIDILQEYLFEAGIRFEVLGFTTSRWRGGASRKLWLSDGKPANPGRLNDLLHIVYRAGEDSSVKLWEDILRPDLLKENVDGEAIEWAVSRLRNISCSNKMLIVISDGAPVDDSTLQANDDESYLSKHLREVVLRLSEEGDVRLGGVGVSYRVGQYFKHSRVAESPRDVGLETINLIEDMVLGEAKVSPASAEDPAMQGDTEA